MFVLLTPSDYANIIATDYKLERVSSQEIVK